MKVSLLLTHAPCLISLYSLSSQHALSASTIDERCFVTARYGEHRFPDSAHMALDNHDAHCWLLVASVATAATTHEARRYASALSLTAKGIAFCLDGSIVYISRTSNAYRYTMNIAVPPPSLPRVRAISRVDAGPPPLLQLLPTVRTTGSLTVFAVLKRYRRPSSLPF